MQNSQEELRSANEELQSTNEELQCTNEELTTSREEMLSLNEELQTVNNELQAQVDELSQIQRRHEKSTNSTDIATLFLDARPAHTAFHIRHPQIYQTDPRRCWAARSRISPPTCSTRNSPEDAQEVLRTLAFKEKPVSIPTMENGIQCGLCPTGLWRKRIDGVVITLADISCSKELEAHPARKSSARCTIITSPT